MPHFPSLTPFPSLPLSPSLMCSKVPTVRCTRDAFKSQRSLSRWSERTKEGTVSPFSPFSFELNGGENGPNSVHSYRRNFSCSTASCSGARAVRSIFIGALHCGKDRKCISKHASKRACRCGDDMLCNKYYARIPRNMWAGRKDKDPRNLMQRARAGSLPPFDMRL